MAYAHCHNCAWEQDDWWSKSYHPIPADRMSELNNMLLSAQHDPSKRMIDSYDSHWLKENHNVRHEVDVREFVASRLENRAARIREMHFLTEKEFYANRVCPNCGSSKHMDVD